MSATIVTMEHSSPRQVWNSLLEGNERFATDSATTPHRDPRRRAEIVEGQNPVAAIVACSDSRVPVELLFDAGFGDLFVIRTAGGCVDAAVSASVEYAVEGLGVPLVVALTHESCGAIGAAIGSVEDPEHAPHGLTRVFMEKIAPSVLAAHAAGEDTREQIEATHAKITAQHLVERIPSINKEGTGVVAARYLLDCGRVETVWEHFAN